MGTSFAEEVRIFAKQSVQDKAMPFTIHLTVPDTGIKLGLAKGKYQIPDEIVRALKSSPSKSRRNGICDARFVHTVL